uniref:Uncharacterized protein n=1 Tax=Panstrongylus lignarius TaxID=156445 RepID=A0A224Y272_9HEMI
MYIAIIIILISPLLPTKIVIYILLMMSMLIHKTVSAETATSVVEMERSIQNIIMAAVRFRETKVIRHIIIITILFQRKKLILLIIIYVTIL